MVKCTKGQVRRLKTALRWKIPPEQRQRIQMVLLRESRMTQPLIGAAMGVSLSTVNRAHMAYDRLRCWSLGGVMKNRKKQHPSERGDAMDLVPGHSANQSLSTVEPVSAPPKWKLKNGEQRPAPKTRRARIEIPKLADQRPGHPSLTCGNVGDSPQREITPWKCSHQLTD